MSADIELIDSGFCPMYDPNRSAMKTCSTAPCLVRCDLFVISSVIDLPEFQGFDGVTRSLCTTLVRRRDCKDLSHDIVS